MKETKTVKLYCAADMGNGKVEVFEWDAVEKKATYQIINGNTYRRTVKKTEIGEVRESLTSYGLSPERALKTFRKAAEQKAAAYDKLAASYRKRAAMPSVLVKVKDNRAVA